MAASVSSGAEGVDEAAAHQDRRGFRRGSDGRSIDDGLIDKEQAGRWDAARNCRRLKAIGKP